MQWKQIQSEIIELKIKKNLKTCHFILNAKASKMISLKLVVGAKAMQ